MIARPGLSWDVSFYPDSDGEPMGDNSLQIKWILKLYSVLEELFIDQPDVAVAGNMFWYPVEGSNNIVTAPDVMVIFDRPKMDRPSYMQWQEEGVAPHFVMEILSLGNRPKEMEKKLRFYEQYGVEEYYLYDPYDYVLDAWRRSGKKLAKIRRTNGMVSPRLGIQFNIEADGLHVMNPDGEEMLAPWERAVLHRREKERLERELQMEKFRSTRALLLLEEGKRDLEGSRREIEQLRLKLEGLTSQLKKLGVPLEDIV